MRQKPNLTLRRIGANYMIVDLSSESVNMANVFNLNESAAAIWQAFEGKEFTEEDVVDYLCREYEVEAEQAAADTKLLLESWQECGLVI